MSERNTIARPYAKAVFQYAMGVGNLAGWSEFLAVLSAIVSDPLSNVLLSNPTVTPLVQSQCLESVFLALSKQPAMDEHLTAFMRLLAENKRLTSLVDIYQLFEAMRAEQEKTLSVNLATVMPLSSKEQAKFAEVLGQRLHRDIDLNVVVDVAVVVVIG